MANNPQFERDKTPKSDQSRLSPNKPEQDRNRERQGRDPQDRDRYAAPNQSANPRRGDDGLVGVDTDGDGKVVKPGQKPGQSHGHGLPENKPGYEAGKKQ